MLLDDRLATVLRSAAQGESAAHTQYRQLLDLLGSMPEHDAGALAEAAYDRLDELAREIPPTVQSAILRAPGLRLRSRALVARLAEGEPQAAAAAMATARLSESDWLALIPRLPVTARGFLRHRRDLPFSARQVLERLGVRDLVLPEPTPAPAPPPPPSPAETPEEPGRAARIHADADVGIGALVRRIEAFRRSRRETPAAPRLPLDEARPGDEDFPRAAFDFSTDAEGVVTWADPAIAPLLYGLSLGPPRPGAVAVLDEAGARALGRRLPLRGVSVDLAGPPEIAGRWRMDAAPAFAPGTGAFDGYRGRMRRVPAPDAPHGSAGRDDAGDRVRQILHELRTPVGAIQGFAELIQQQLFGPVPHEYRALAAAVAVDAARLLAGFEEIDRLARLEIGAIALDEGECDLREVLGRLSRRLEGVLRPRSARMELAVSGGPFHVGLDESEALRVTWRLLATLAGAIAPGETIDLTLAGDGRHLTLEAGLPAALAGESDLFAASASTQPRAVSAGMFGIGFTLRLARAEVAAARGTLEQRGDALRLVLPVLTGRQAAHTVDRRGGSGPSAA